MSELKHTPGPWIADRYDVRQSGSTGSRMVAAICYTGPLHTPASEYPKSCRLQDEANARLIASAPEMLAALEMALDQSWNGPIPDSVREKCAAVISKAKGAKL
jgi:hypothetical protein